MNKDILQKFIDNNADYLIGNRHIKGMGASIGQDEWEAVLLAPAVKKEFWGKDIGALPYDDVVSFADEEITTIIHLGDTYSPFQYGIKRKDFVNLEIVTCKPMDLIVRCHQGKINDYYEVLEVMKSLIKTKGEDK